MEIQNSKDILLIIPSLDRGGTENICKTLFIGLSEEKNLNIILFILDKKRANNFYDEIDNKLKKNIKFASRRNWFFIFFSISKLIYSNNFKSIFCFNSETALITIIIKKLLNKHFYILLRVNNSVKKKIIHFKNPLKKFIYYLYNYISLSNSDQIIVQSKEMKNEIRNILKNDKNLKIIYNPLSNKFIRQNKLMRKSQYILFVGSLLPKKNPLMILKIYNKFIQNNKKRIKLKIVGAGEELNKLKDFINKNNLQNKVEIIKPVNQSKLQELYSRALCLILCSKYEGFPNVAIESIFCGTPVLAYRAIGGIEELIINGINGIKVSNYDIKSYLKSLDIILGIKFDKKEIIKTAERYNTKNIIKRYTEILK